jgi:hypothetical protein
LDARFFSLRFLFIFKSMKAELVDTADVWPSTAAWEEN